MDGRKPPAEAFGLLLVLLRQVSVPAGEEHGGDGVGHDVGRLVGQELLDAHGRDGEAGAHLVPDLFSCSTQQRKKFNDRRASGCHENKQI